MTPGLQEAIALGIALLAMRFALYSRWRKGTKMNDCCASPPSDNTEKTVHFYRRDQR